MLSKEQINKGLQIAAAIEKAVEDKGLSKDKIGLLLLQVAHETGGFNSNVSTFLNMSGIKWNPKGKIVPGEYDSKIKSPEGNNYSGFDSVDAWANRYTNILAQAKTKPLEATSIDDFAKRLKGAGYYTATLESYTKALKSWASSLKTHLGSLPLPATIAATTVVALLIVSLIIMQ